MATRQDQDLLEDVLITEKNLCSLLTTGVTECATANVRTDIKDVLNNELDIQNQVFNTMSTKGWYQPEAAEQNKITQARNKFAQRPMNS